MSDLEEKYNKELNQIKYFSVHKSMKHCFTHMELPEYTEIKECESENIEEPTQIVDELELLIDDALDGFLPKLK